MVDVGLEDAFLAVSPLQSPGHQGFADLAPQRSLRTEFGEDVARNLLRDGRCALDDASGSIVGPRGARYCTEIDAAMVEEAHVLRGQDGLDEHGRQLARARRSPMTGFDIHGEWDLSCGRTVGGDDDAGARDRCLPSVEVRNRGKAAGVVPEYHEPEQGSHDRGRKQSPDEGRTGNPPPQATFDPVADAYATGTHGPSLAGLRRGLD